jgi:hypothetical protein
VAAASNRDFKVEVRPLLETCQVPDTDLGVVKTCSYEACIPVEGYNHHINHQEVN